MTTDYSALFEPIRIGTMEIKNRLVVPAIGTLFCNHDGHICDRLIYYHLKRAKGGFGLLIVEGVAISINGRGGPKQFGIWNDSFIPEYKRLTDIVHKAGAKIALQIMHVGRSTRPEIIAGEQPVAPSAIADPVVRSLPKELTKEEIKGLTASFALAARRAQLAGFDAVELHGGHGYLIAQFMSAYANQRSDEYGGDFEGFLRFPLEILQEMRSQVGSDFPIIFRISGEEAAPQGRKLTESVAVSKRLVAAGVDALHVSIGVYESSYLTMAPSAQEQGFNAQAAQAIKAQVPVPIIAVGRIIDPAVAKRIITTGQADMVALGRQSLADPLWPRKVKENQVDSLVKCLSCNDGCLGLAWKARAITCVQNPALGKEVRYASVPVSKHPARILIAGGGPAGLEAARTAALRGHQVTLYEKEDRLGGQIHIAATAPTKENLKEVIHSRLTAIAKMAVEIKLKQTLTPALIKEIAPEVLIIATGSTPLWPNIPGLDRQGVISARSALMGSPVGKNAVIIGGGLVGCETADYLASQGKAVTLIEMMPALAKDAAAASRYFLLQRLARNKVNVFTATTVEQLTDEAIIVSKEGEEKRLPLPDTILLATGAQPLNTLEAAAQQLVPRVYVIGDALRPGNILKAVQQATKVGWQL